MKGKLESGLGEVFIESSVLARCAGLSAVECFGVVGMAAVSMTDGLVKLLKRESLTKGVNVIVDEDNNVNIDFHIIVAYGVSISAVSEALTENVKYAVETFSGLTVKKINIYVEGVRVID